MWGHSRIGVGLVHSLRHAATAQAWMATYVAAKAKVLNMTWVVILLLALESVGALMSSAGAPSRLRTVCCRNWWQSLYVSS